MRYGILNFSTDTEVEREIIKDEDIHCFESRNEEDLPDDVSELEACMVWHDLTLSKKSIDRLKKCKVIVCVGVGYNNVDIEYAGSLGIPVVNVPDYGTNDVADHAFGLLLTLCRKIMLYNNKLIENPVNNWDATLGGEIHRITDSSVGIVGLGRIGTAFALRAKAFGMHVSFYDPYIPDGYDKALNVTRTMCLEDLFYKNDYISIHAPLTHETNNMIDSAIIENCRPGLTIVNTARGAIVNLDAVYHGLKSNRLRAFAADVLKEEPPITSHPLIDAYMKCEKWLDGRVVLTPHAAFYAEESRYEMRKKAAQQMQNAVIGLPLRNCVNKDYLISK